MFTFDPLPHTEAVKRIADLPLVSRAMFDELLPELKAYAFTITGLDSFDQLSRARDLIKAVPAGEKTWDKAKKEIADELSSALGGTEAKARAELLLRTHTFRGYAVSRYRLLMQQRAVFPFWQYKTHGDDRVRPSHVELSGKIFPAGHPIWQRIFPPWDWGCRCLVVPLMGNDVARRADEEKDMSPDAKSVFDGDLADAIHAGERLPNGVSLLPSPTWAASPWSEPGTVRHTWSLIQDRYSDDPETLLEFVKWSQKTKIDDLGIYVSDWLDGAKLTKFAQPLYTDRNNFTVQLSKEDAAEIRKWMSVTGTVSEGTPLKPLEEIMQRSEQVAAFEAEVVGDVVENGASWSHTGRLIDRRRSNERDSVSLRTVFGGVASHNHPDAKPFGQRDLDSFFEAQLAELRATSSEHLFRIQPGAKARPLLKLRDIPGYAHIATAADAVSGGLASSEIERDKCFFHAVLVWLARSGFINYERLLIP